MLDQKAINYVKDYFSKGYTLEKIKQALIQSGRTETEVDRLIFIAVKKKAPPLPQGAVKPDNKKDKKEEKKKDKKGKQVQMQPGQPGQHPGQPGQEKKKDVNWGLIIPTILVIVILGGSGLYYYLAKQGYAPAEPVLYVEDVVSDFLANLNMVKESLPDEDEIEGTREIVSELLEQIDCGNDMKCFDENLQTCHPAKFETGIGDEMRFEFIIEGVDNTDCKIHHVATVHPMERVQGSYYDCKIPKAILDYSIYEAWIKENMYTKCTGTYIDRTKDTINSTNETAT